LPDGGQLKRRTMPLAILYDWDLFADFGTPAQEPEAYHKYRVINGGHLIT